MRLLAIALVFLFCAVTSAYGDMIQTGVVHNGYLQDEGNWNLHIAQPAGEREFKHHINFPQEFTDGLPIVLVMLSGVDSDNATNQRVLVTTDNITQYGFNVLYKTWWDTRLYGAWVTWIAIPRSMVYTDMTEPLNTSNSTMNVNATTASFAEPKRGIMVPPRADQKDVVQKVVVVKR